MVKLTKRSRALVVGTVLASTVLAGVAYATPALAVPAPSVAAAETDGPGPDEALVARKALAAEEGLTVTEEGRVVPPEQGVAAFSAGGMTVANARARAESYLRLMSFSRHGLISQIEFEQFPTDVAVAAVDSLRVDWNGQAVQRARSYLRTFPNWNSLRVMDQLTSTVEGFTTAQAMHATRAVFGANAPVIPAPPTGTRWAFEGDSRAFVSNQTLNTGTTWVPAGFAFPAGRATDDLIMGDWDGDGVDSPMIRRGNTFFYTNDPRGVGTPRSFTFGRVGDDVFVGDWDGNGTDTIGLRRGNVFFLNNVLAPGNAEISFDFGRVGDEIHIGDWDNNRTDTVGLRRGNTFFLSNRFAGGWAEIQFDFGRLADEVLIGDWDGNGTDSIGLRRHRTFFLSNTFAGGWAEIQFEAGIHGEQVIVGNFNGRGGDTLLFRR